MGIITFPTKGKLKISEAVHTSALFLDESTVYVILHLIQACLAV